MAILKCKMCGGDLNVTETEKVVECEYCGSKQTIPTANDEKKVNLFNRANRLRIASEFDKASAIYEQIIAEFPEEAEAYWGLLLSNYGIEYVDDPKTGNKIPTCHRASFEKMRKNENYELALEYAGMDSRNLYEDEAKEIDRIMGEILEVTKNEEPYDIFICYKETARDGGRTPDSVLAQDIYDALTGKGYKVFFSRITLEDKLGVQYEPYIFSALNSSKVMLAIGTDYEYYNAVWVKNEWSRFLKLIEKDKSKILIPCYKDMDPYDMPEEFKGLQSQDCSKLGFMQDLTRGIDKLFGKTEQVKVVVNDNRSPAVNGLVERVLMFLEDKDWDKANEYCEKVLDLEPQNANAYLGKLMVDLKVSKRQELGNYFKSFEHNVNYGKVVRFGDENLVTEIKGYIEQINERNSQNELAEKRKIDETVDMIAAVLYKQNCLEIQTRLEALNKEKEKLTVAFNEFDEINEKRKPLTEKINSLDENINELQAKRNLLGAFDFKGIKAIDAELSELVREKEAIKEMLDKMCGFTSKIEVEKKLVEVEAEIKDTYEGIDKANNTIFSLSIAEAYDILDDNAICVRFIEKYSRLYKQYLKNKKNAGESIKFGAYKQGIYGIKTPIEWEILTIDENKALLISKYPLDCEPYDYTMGTNVTWETCSLREWLNNYFLNEAFDSTLQKRIVSSKVTADENPNYYTNPGNDTTDKVFLLSITEVEKYLPSDSDRKCKPTDYTVAKGAYKDDNGYCDWWLRSPGGRQNYAADVFNVGSVHYRGFDVDYVLYGVRPALWITLES